MPTPAPTVGRTIFVFWKGEREDLPMPATVVQIVERPRGWDGCGIWVIGFPPHDHALFRFALRDAPYLLLSAVEGETMEKLYWRWPPRV